MYLRLFCKMKYKAHILLVEDDESLAFVIRDNLEKEGYIVTHVSNGDDGHKCFDTVIHDLCILDVMLPKMDGFTCAENIRKKDQNTPILFLTAKSLTADKIEGFRRGGDDYITKPFDFQELLYRIKVFHKRSLGNTHSVQESFEHGNLNFNHTNLRLQIGDKETTLTQKEADLLQYLIKNKNVLQKREDILRTIWGDDDYFMGRSLDVFISRLRKYLTPAKTVRIINNHGVGFKLVTDT